MTSVIIAVISASDSVPVYTRVSTLLPSLIICIFENYDVSFFAFGFENSCTILACYCPFCHYIITLLKARSVHSIPYAIKYPLYCKQNACEASPAVMSDMST